MDELEVSLELWSFSNREVRQGFNKLSHDFCVNFVGFTTSLTHVKLIIIIYRHIIWIALKKKRSLNSPLPLCLAFQYHGQLTMVAQIADGVSQIHQQSGQKFALPICTSLVRDFGHYWIERDPCAYVNLPIVNISLQRFSLPLHLFQLPSHISFFQLSYTGLFFFSNCSSLTWVIMCVAKYSFMQSHYIFMWCNNGMY